MSEPTLALRRQPRDSLATKIIFFVFFSTFVTALVVSWISVQSSYSFLRSHLDSAYPLQLDRAVARVQAVLDAATRDLESLSAEPALQRLAGGDRDALAAAQPALDALAERRHELAGVWLADVRGVVIASASSAAVPTRLARDAGPPGEAASVRALHGQLVASAPLRAPGGAAIGALHAAVAHDALRPVLASARSADEGPLYVVDAAGQVVLAAERSGAPPPFASFPMELLARPAHAPAVDFRGAQGRRGIGAAAPLGVAGWHLVVAEPLEAAFAPVFSVVTRVFVIDLAIILVFSFLAYEITAKIVRPVDALSEGARRISQGELDVEVADTGTHDEIGLLTRTFNDMAHQLRRNREEIEQQHRRLREQNEELQRANEVLEQLSITDGLTKLHNHRYFQESLTRELKRVSRSGEPLSILLADIDDFKALNDRHGHAQGDALLVRIARVLNESVRESDILARYGGEEFVVLATGTDLAGALFVAEKLRTAVAESVYVHPETLEPLRVTISIGVAEFAGDRRRFFDAADRALYRAKAAGKNCVMAAGPSDLA
jgi:diguanylate cyclase (GGDEF)-like protein